MVVLAKRRGMKLVSDRERVPVLSRVLQRNNATQFCGVIGPCVVAATSLAHAFIHSFFHSVPLIFPALSIEQCNIAEWC